MDSPENIFRYTYSAQQQAEVARIRSKYQPEEPDKMARLRALDRSASQKAQAWAITLGVLGALVLGMGMSLFMTDLGQAMGLHQTAAMVTGVLTGGVGLVLLALAYPVYNRVLKRQRQRIAPEVLRLTDELLK